MADGYMALTFQRCGPNPPTPRRSVVVAETPIIHRSVTACAHSGTNISLPVPPGCNADGAMGGRRSHAA